MKKLISILIILCLTINLAFALRVPSVQAGELVIKEKDPEKAKKLAIFPGILIHGVGQIYAGETTDGLLNLTSQIFFIDRFIYSVNVLRNIDKNDPVENAISSIVFWPIAIGSFGGIFVGIAIDYFYSPELVERWNEAVDKNDFSKIKQTKMKKVKTFMGVGLAYCAAFILASPSNWLETIKSTLIIPTIISTSYLLEASRLTKGNEKKSEINLFPVVKHNYYGMVLVKSF